MTGRCSCLCAADDWWWHRIDLRRVYSSRWARTDSRCAAEGLVSWRFAVWLWLIATVISNWAISSQQPRHLSYLTYWGAWLTIWSFGFSALAGIFALCVDKRKAAAKPAEPRTGRSWSEIFAVHVARAAHALTMIAVPLELIICPLYWLALYKAGNNTTSLEWYRDLTVHAMCFTTCWIDVCLGAKRFPDRHIIIVLITAVCYLAVNIGVTLGTGIYVYSILKWDGGGSVAVAAGALIASIIFFYLAGWLSWVLNLLARKCGPCGCGCDGAKAADKATAGAGAPKEELGEVYLAALGGVVPKAVAESISAAKPVPANGEVRGVVFAQAALLVADPFPAHPMTGLGVYNQPFAQHGLGFFDEFVTLATKFWCCIPKVQAPLADGVGSAVELTTVGAARQTAAPRPSQHEALRAYRSPALADESTPSGAV